MAIHSISGYSMHKDSILTAIDARVKMVFSFSAIILCVISSQIYTGIALFFTLMLALIAIRVPFFLIGARMLAPLGIVSVIVVLRVFMHGTTPLFHFELIGFQIIGYAEGLAAGLLIASKVCGAVSAIVFLSLTTPVNKLLHAACYFKVPHTFVELALLSYRYVFVLCEDAITVMNAQRVRLGYTGYLRSLRSFGQLAGAIVIRAYDQSIATYEAMKMRGFTGTMNLDDGKSSLQTIDWYAMIMGSAVLIGLLSLEICLR